MRIRDLSGYCWAGREFFDTPGRADDADTRYPNPTALDEQQWTRTENGIWVHVGPVGDELRDQGWKIHVSATLDDAPKVLDIVWRYCVAHRITFKFVRSERLLMMLNEKSANRAGSGKFMAIYLADDAELATVLGDLDTALTGFHGPYILSDLRHREGPLYVRYGAFRSKFCRSDDGDPVPAVRRPDGTLVPDVRAPRFVVPDWVRLPAVLEPDLAARGRQITDEFPYRIDRAIQFSNSGGVYLATDERSGEQVVVREARPHAGLDRRGDDAVRRMRRERDQRARLAGLTCVPQLLDHRVVDGHHYLIEEYIDGHTLFTSLLGNYPLADPLATDDGPAAHVSWVDDVVTKIDDALTQVHGRGVSHGDVHPSNILIRPDGSVVLIDFEFSTDLADPRQSPVAAHGFNPPAGVTGAAADRYALEQTHLMCLMPLAGLVERDRAKLRTLIDAAVGEGLPVTGRQLTRLLRHRDDHSGDTSDLAAAMFADAPNGLIEVKESLTRAILASATPDRADRLFPGDPSQFVTGGVNVDSGAAGVLFALHRTGADIPGELVDWLVDATARMRHPAVGLHTGLHGVAVVLDLLGRRDQALQVLDRARELVVGHRRVGLRDGLAGIALGLTHLAASTGEAALLDEAVLIADRLGALIEGRLSGGLSLPERFDLMQGTTGIGLLFLHLYEELADERYLTLARSCLRRDLDRCVPRGEGTCYVRDGGKHLMYLNSGAMGLAMVIARYLRHRNDPGFEAAVRAIRLSSDAPFCLQPGLIEGRAGIILGLCSIGHPDDAGLIRRHVRRLGWHALHHRGELAFPGAHNLRLSMDYGTGSAGVLLAVQTVLHRASPFLPATTVISSPVHQIGALDTPRNTNRKE